MPIDPRALSVTDFPEDLADWLEIRTFRDRDGNGSQVELLKALRMSGTRDALDDEDETTASIESWEDPYEGAVQSAFLEIEDRFNACGGTKYGMYPFALGDDYIALRKGTSDSVYTFLLLLSQYGGGAGTKPREGPKLFEEVCAKAAEEYIGGANDTVKSHVFGFPRRVLPSGFKKALQELCNQLKEGEGPRSRPSSSDQKDAKLDVVAWRDFDDGREGKLITFGQCGTGRTWSEKLTELQPGDWCRLWMKDPPAVTPVRTFFVPYRVGRTQWFHLSVKGGILFDRCRISRHSSLIGAPLRKQLANWSKGVLSKIGAI